MPAEDRSPANRLSRSLDVRLSLLEGRPDGDPLLLSDFHAFIEAYMREKIPEMQESRDFAELLRAFARRLGTRGRSPDASRAVSRLIQEHAVLLRYAAGGGAFDPEETRAARHNFLAFCALCGIDDRVRGALSPALAEWKERRAAPWKGSERARLQYAILDLQDANAALLSRSVEWAQDRKRLAELDGEMLRLDAERRRAVERDDAGTERAASLDAERAECERQKAAIAARLDTYRDLDEYVQNVRRYSLYTRTRMDYERGVMQLTAEQEEAVDAVRPGRDFLIRGGAGTGKTIVLLHALGSIVRGVQGELALHPDARILFLTYTNTLVKYDRYVAEILREGDADKLIHTADSFFQERLRLLGRQQRIDYGIAGRLAAALNTTGFLSAPELAVEIEDFIFANLVTRREYVEERIPRRGMRQPLSAGQREAVWALRDKFVETMEHDGVLSRNYSRAVLIRRLEAAPEDPALRDLDFAFVDESQDLTAADLRALKLMTRRGLIMAGDTGQSIYGVSSPYRRAGVEIAGRTRVLHSSFRNTVPIQEIADAYRALSGLEEEDGAGAAAFRDGPAPELYTAGTRSELAQLVLRKTALFIDTLGYDPENIAILAPTKTDLATIGDALGHAGYRYANIRDEEFSFKETGTIRLSTLHSSKGLDFAVVLLYLPALPPRGDFDERAGQGIVRNLLYVAMTRAMDNLNVFTLDGAHDGQQEEPLQDLVRVFRHYRRKAMAALAG